MLPAGKSYQEVYDRFRWVIPEYYNIAVDVCDRHADDPSRLALIYEDEAGHVEEFTFAQMRARSNQFAHVLARLGVERGHRVGIVLSQRPETAIAHLATYKLGGIALPLSTLFGPDALDYRLRDSGARLVVTDAENLDKVLKVRPALPDLDHVVVADDADAPGTVAFRREIDRAPEVFTPVRTRAEDPALIIYTSGTTGPPKGALHAHRVLLGHLPGIEFYHDFFPRPGDRYWSPADWAWAGGLLDVLLPSWHHGSTVVAYRTKRFDPERAFALVDRHRVRNTLLVPTMLKLMRQVSAPRSRYRFDMRTIMTGGEPVGEEIIRWCQTELAITPNEAFGQTEVNVVLGNCAALMPVKPGSMGRPVPGHVVEVVDDHGRVVPPGEVGEVAIRRPDPVMFLGYWNNPKATTEKFVGDWALTGDLGRKDDEGYFWFVGRKDDLISSGGYRIGPGEIEDCLARHPAVLLAAAVGSPDPVRGEVVKAFVLLREGHAPTPAVAKEIQAFVRDRLSAHEYPREIEFVDSLPTTTTGKVKRGDLRRLEIERHRGRAPGATGPRPD